MTDWAIPQQAKLKYTQLFNLHDRSRGGFLSGIQCRDILMQSGLPRNILAEIWNLSDIDGDGQLTREEFILALHLTNQVRAGQTLPQTLPADLVPPSYRRTRSISATSVHSATSATSSVSSGAINEDQTSSSYRSTDTAGGASAAAAATAASSILNSNSFEDKRRENFEKGRAELERRRLKIIEQQTSILSEQLARCKKDVAEAKAKIDSMRTERDTKAGLITALEAQVKTIRDRKAFLDHEEVQIIAIAKDLNLVQSSGNSADLDQQATAAKQESISKMKEQLVGMQSERDATLKKVAEARARLEESKSEFKSVSEDANKRYDEYKVQIEKAKTLKQQFIEENKSKPIDLDSVWDAPSPHIPVVSHQSSSISRTDSAAATTTAPAFQQSASEDSWSTAINTSASTKPSSYDPFAFASTTPESNNNNINNNITTSSAGISPNKILSNEQQQSPSSVAFDSGHGGFNDAAFGGEPMIGQKMYRAVYAFEARNPDELTLNPGDIVIGSEEVCEPGWLSGKIGERNGLFPEAYVEPMADNELAQVATTAIAFDEFGAALPVTYSTSTASPAARTTSPQQQQQQQQQSAASSDLPAIVKYKVVYAFEARNVDELTMNPGDIITGVEGPHEPGWLMGELNGQRGLFPEAYVEKLADTQGDHQATAESTGTLRRGSSSGSLRSKKSRAKKAEVATVIANYRALGQEQLNLEKGQLVSIRRKMDSGWWEGELQIKDRRAQTPRETNTSDQFHPTNKRLSASGAPNELDHLVGELVNSEWDYVNDLRLCQSAYIFPLSSSFEVDHIFTHWNQLIQMHEHSLTKLSNEMPPPPPPPAMTNGSVVATATRQKLNYRLVLETFHQLFGSIGDLYVDFCSRHNEALRQLEAKMASDMRFKQLVSESQRKLRKLIEHQQPPDESAGDDSQQQQQQQQQQERARALRNSNLPLTSFLLKPMQRITKYGLLFDRMLKIVTTSTRYKHLQAPLVRLKQAAEALCRQVNEACRLKEDEVDNQRRLRWCQSHIMQQSSLGFDTLTGSARSSFNSSGGGSPFSCVDLRSSLANSNEWRETTACELIQFKSNTNCLGPRRLIKAASLLKLRSGRELIVFLFNDLLLLTQLKGGGGSLRVDDVFRSERAQQAYYKLYRPPLLLEQLQLDNFDPLDQLQPGGNSLSCPSMIVSSSSSSVVGANSATSSGLLSKEQEALMVSFLDRNSGCIYNLLASNPKERAVWVRLLGERVSEARAQIAAASPPSAQAHRRLSVTNSIGRLFVTVLELIRVSGGGGALKTTINEPTWERRQLAAVHETVQNLCVRLQLRLYKRAVNLVDEREARVERREVVPTSDEFCTNRVLTSESRRQPTMVDMNESMSNLELQRDVFKFELDSSQFLLGPSSPLGHEYLDLELLDDARFRETRLLARKRLALEQLLGQGSSGESSPARRSSSRQSGRNIQPLQTNRPVDMTFKLKPVESPGGARQAPDEHKYLVKLRLHLQMFCDIQHQHQQLLQPQLDNGNLLV